MSTTMDNPQIGGSHYASKTIQPLEVMRSWMSPEQYKGYLRGNIIKYSCRCDDKGKSVDIRKLIQYAEVLADVMEEDERPPVVVEGCSVPPDGWQCLRAKGHAGPCAALKLPPSTPRS